MKYQRPKGTRDILPAEAKSWQAIEQAARMTFGYYDFHEIRTPIFEHFEVIARSVGATTDIVSKEMYDFYDKSKRHLTLRPEATAPVVRSYVENRLYGPEHQRPFKAYYIGPMFRYERPQSGRLRQFHQIGVEVIGSHTVLSDVETIAMAMAFFKRLGITQIKLVINSLGSRENRERYRQQLIDYLAPFEKDLSEHSQRRLYQNPLRILDSKEKEDQVFIQEAPSILDFLDAESHQFFSDLQTSLTDLNIEFEIDPRMVRGLDYYNHTVFEIMSEAKGFAGVKTTLCAGGRYDGLIREFGGPTEVDAGFGFAIGIERALIAVAAENQVQPAVAGPDIYIADLTTAGSKLALQVAQLVRANNLQVKCDYLPRSLGAHLRLANKIGATLLLMIGADELAGLKVKVKNMQTGNEREFLVSELEQDFLNHYFLMVNL